MRGPGTARPAEGLDGFSAPKPEPGCAGVADSWPSVASGTHLAYTASRTFAFLQPPALTTASKGAFRLSRIDAHECRSVSGGR